jgi:hypothetical protein
MQTYWLHFLDVFFTLLHLVIIGFNLLGWIWKSTRKLHFYLVLLTTFSWLVMGYWFGLGYCPITDWQWQVKNKLGEHNLPTSFIKYMIDKVVGIDSSTALIDTTTALCFAIVALLAVYLHFFRKK